MYVILHIAAEKALKIRSPLHRLESVTVLSLDKGGVLWQYIVEVFK